MNDDPLWVYRIGQPLTVEETGLIKGLQSHDPLANEILATGLRIDVSLNGESYLFAPDLSESGIAWINSYCKFGEYQFNQGNFEVGYAAFALALRIAIAVRGIEHSETLIILNNVAVSLRRNGRAIQAELIYRKLLELQRKLRGERHPETLISLHNLATCLQSSGRVEEAESLHRQALELSREVLGEYHPSTLASLNNLALCLGKLGRILEAEPLCRELLALCREKFGERHPFTSNGLNNLAGCLLELDHMEEAESLFRQALDLRSELLGEYHPDTITSLHNLAFCLNRLGRMGEAEPLHQKVLALRRQVLGEHHPETLSSLNNLASCLSGLGRIEEAMHLHQQVSLITREVLGEYHPETLGSLYNFANSLRELGKAERAREQSLKLANALVQHPNPAQMWMRAALSTSEYLSHIAQENAFPDWPEYFQALDQAFRQLLDLQDPAQLFACRSTATYFYRTYLKLCIEQRQDLVLVAFFGLQGRKLAALVLDELEQQDVHSESLHGRFHSIRVKLRQSALGLSVLEGSMLCEPRPRGQERSANDIYAEQRARLQVYRDAFHDYERLRAELQRTDQEFALSTRALKPDLAEIQAKLGEGEALMLLIEADDQTLAFIVRRDRTDAQSLPLAFAEASAMTGEYSRLAQVCGHRNAYTFEDEENAAEVQEDELADARLQAEKLQFLLHKIQTSLAGGLWQPLKRTLPDIRRVHLVTHGDLHVLPYELGCPVEWQLSTYPGLVYYYLLRHLLPQVSLNPDQVTLGLRVHDADETANPIPMVNVEAAVVEKQWAGEMIRPYQFAPDAPSAQWLHLAAHGYVDEQDGSRAALHLGPGENVGFHELYRSLRGREVKGVFLASCLLGRTRDDPDGDPLGFMGALFLRGARYVIAALQPVPDFYMPLLVCLFYQSWQRDGGHPARALADAKRRIIAGDWFDDTETLIRAAYLPVVNRPSSGYTEADIDILCADRHTLPVAEMCHWIRGFGEGGDWL